MFLHPELKFENYMLSAESIQHMQIEIQNKTHEDSKWEISFRIMRRTRLHEVKQTFPEKKVSLPLLFRVRIIATYEQKCRV